MIHLDRAGSCCRREAGILRSGCGRKDPVGILRCFGPIDGSVSGPLEPPRSHPDDTFLGADADPTAESAWRLADRAVRR